MIPDGIGDSVGHWAVHLVFSPVVWLGIVLTGVSAVLFGASALLRGRGSAPELGAPPARAATPARGKAAIGDGDLDDIEAILRRHGIS